MWAGDKGWGHCMVDPHVDGGWDRIVPHDLLLTIDIRQWSHGAPSVNRMTDRHD